MASKQKPVPGPRLFGVHLPVMNEETKIIWQVAGRTFTVIDRGATWAFNGLLTFAGGYSDKFAAKRALERHIRQERKLLGKVMGLA